jgi:D-aspartate ligase
MKQPVFVLGSFIGALGVVQSLGSRGVPCWICAPKKNIAARSRFARFWEIPEPHGNDVEILARLRELATKTGGRPVVIPAGDNFALVLARLASSMQDDFAVCVAPLPAVELVNDKERMAAWGQAFGLPCVRTLKVSEIAEPPGYPVVIKPINKFYFEITARNLPPGSHPMEFAFTLIDDRESWHEFRSHLRDNLDQLVVQEYVPGTTSDMYSVGFYAGPGSEILATFVMRKIRGYPALSGETKAGQNDEMPEPIMNSLRQAVRALRLQGIVEFEFRRNPETGEFKLLDVNPRAWTWIGITTASPANIPWVAYQDLCGEVLEPASETRPPGSIKYVFLLSDFLSVAYRYRKDYPPWAMSPWRWWKTLRARQLVIAEINQGDWLAGLFFIYFHFRSLCKRVARPLLRRYSGGAGAAGLRDAGFE